MALVETIVGERKASSNVQADLRGGPYSEVIVNDIGFGKFFEAGRLNRLFSLSTALNATLNGNAAPLGAAGTPVIGIHNVASNLKAAVILKAACQLIPAGTSTGIVPVWYYIPPPTNITAIGSSGAVPCLLGTSTSTMKTFVNAVLTGSAAATTLRPWFASGGPNGATAAAATYLPGLSMFEETDGTIVVPPGTFLGVGFNVAGAGMTGCLSFTWAEIDWPLL